MQATSTQEIGGFNNRLVVGASVDHAVTSFLASSELGVFQPDLTLAGFGTIIDDPAGDDAPVSLKATNTYYGLYALDAFDVTDRLTVTGGARYNFANISTVDRLGTALNGNNNYAHLNPLLGATYKLTPDITIYGGFSEANRAPTPLELGCADPAHPCLIDNFLVSDPHLRQVVSRTFEAGLRGKFTMPQLPGRFDWSAGVFRATNAHDILNVPSDVTGLGFFENVGPTRRQGVELALKYTDERWSAYARYSFLDATFRSDITLASPFNPFADANGDILVHPGDRIPSIAAPEAQYRRRLPRHRFADHRRRIVTSSASCRAAIDKSLARCRLRDGQRRGSYQLWEHAKVYALVGNAFDTHYKTFGILADPAAVPFLNLTNPRSFTLGPPLSVQMGVKATF